MANPVFVKTTDSYIAALMKVTMNAATGNTYLNQFRNFVTENGGGTTGLQKLGSALANYASTDNTAFAATVVSNLGITGDSATTAKTNVKALLDSYGADRGKALMQLVDVMVNLQADATWGTAANAFVNSVNTGHAYSVNTANTSTDLTVLAAVMGVTNGAVTGQNFTLTNAQDTFNGNAGADILRAVAGAAVGAQDQTTLNSSDVLDGAAGEDSLVVNMTGFGTYQGGATIKNIETLQIGSNLAAAQFDYNVNAGVYEVTGVNTVIYDQINAGETLNVINVTPSATGTVIPTLKWDNEAGSAAGTAGVTFRQASVASATTQLNVVLDDVNAGVFNIGGGVETIKVTSQGTTTNTLNGSANVDGSPAVDILSASEDGINNNGALTKVIVDGAMAFGSAAGVVATAGANQGLTNRAVGADGGFVVETPVTASNLISVAATVTEIDATANTGGVNMRFTPRVNGAEVSQVFKGSEAADYVEFEVGNVNAAGNKGNDTFAFLNNQFNSTFTTLDTVAGGEGTDTIQLGVNGRGVYNIDWTEFNNKTGIDVLDLRGAQNNVTLADSFVSSADAGLTVRTDKIVQTSAASVANPTGGSVLEDASTTTLNLTKLAANRAITFEGGSGSDRVIGNEASITSAATLKGGANVGPNNAAVAGDYDTLTVIDSAVLSRGDVSNISGFEGLVLVKSDTTAARTFSVELTEAFLLANTAANSNATDINDAVFAITTGAGVGGSNILTAADRISIDVTDLFNTTNGTYKTTLAGRSVDINGLIAAVGAANVTIVYNGTSTTLAAAPAAVQAAITNVGTNSAQVLGSAGLVAGSGGGSGAGAAAVVAVAGNTYTLTAAGAVVATGAAATNATLVSGTNNGTTANQDIINGLSFSTATIADGTAGDADQYNVNVIGAIAPTAVSGIENINLTLNAGGNFNAAGVVTAANQFINVVTGTGIISGLTAAHNINVNAGAAGTTALNAAANGNAFTVSLGGTTTEQLNFFDANGTTAATGNVTLTANAASSVTGITTGAVTLTTLGTGTLNLGTVTGATTVTAAGMTGAATLTGTFATATQNVTGTANADTLTFTAAGAQQVTTGTGADVLTAGTAAGAATVLTVNDWTNGTDALTILAGARGNITTAAGGATISGVTNSGTLGVTGTTSNDLISTANVAGNAVVAGGNGNDQITFNATGANTVVFGGTAVTAATVNVDTVTNFNAVSTATNAADTIVFGSTFLNGNSFAGSAAVKVSTSGGLASGDDAGIYVASAGSAADDAAVAALTNAFSAGGSQKAVFIINDAGGNANIWYVNDSLDGTATDVTASDVVLIGTLTGQSAATLTAANFGASLAI